MKFIVILVLLVSEIFANLDILETKLKNGIKVLLLKKDTPVVSVAIMVGSGSYSDPYGKAGLAHYTEHAMFKGLKDAQHGAEFSKFTKMTGARFNAFTAYNITAFHTQVPSQYLDDLLNIESQRFNGFSIEKESAATERDVVLEELNMYNNMDQYLFFQDSMAALYLRNNYRHSIAGYRDEIQTFTVDDVKTFLKDNYVANNMKIIVISDVPHDEIREKLNDLFGDIDSGDKYDKGDSDRRINLGEDVDYPRSSYSVIKTSPETASSEIALFWKIPSSVDKTESAALEICAHILQNKASSFAKTLIKDKQIASSVATLNNTGILRNEGCPPNLFILEASGFSGIKSQVLLENINSELSKLLDKGFDEKDLNVVKEQLNIINAYRNDNVSNLFNFLIKIGINYTYQDYLEYLETIKSLDIEYVNKVFNKYLRKSPDVISHLKPKQENQNDQKSNQENN